MISVVTCTIRESCLPRIIENFTRQTLPEKELIIILNKNGIQFEPPAAANIRVYRLDEAKTLGECLNFGVRHSRYEIIAKFDDDDDYSPAYLENSLLLMRKTGASVVGKAAIFVYFTKKRLLTLFRPRMKKLFLKNQKVFLAGGTLVFQKKVFDQVSFQELNLGEDVQFQRDCLLKGIPLYSGSYHDYVLIRYNGDHQHSWQIDDAAFLKHCKKVAVTDSFEEYVWKGGRKL